MKDVVEFQEKSAVAVSLVDLLHSRAAEEPGKIVFTFLEDELNETGCLTYGQLHERVMKVAAKLQALEAAGERALLLYPPGLDYIIGFFGCLYAGVTAVPAYPPDPTRLNRTLPRLQAICTDSQAKFALTTSPILQLAGLFLGQAAELQALTWLATDTLDLQSGKAWERPNINGDTLAFLQYTSGSTGMPKGVMLSHANLLQNSALITQAFSITASDSAVIWLPPYHDMGLIGGLLQPIYRNIPCVLMPPTTFLQRPFSWLKTISHYRSTISGGPNFAFDLCVRKISAEQRKTLDLSSWRVAFNGAEPIRNESLNRFAETFGPVGFQARAFEPCYGLAEATLIASGDTKGTSPATHSVQKAGLTNNLVIPAEISGTPQVLVSSGQSLGDQEIIIVQSETRTQLPDEMIGEVWLAGGSVARGYWNNPVETAEIFQAFLANGRGPYLRTGDLGFLREGDLFITGRTKDLIIIRGRNHYPQDIELTVEASHPALRKGCAAAFAIEADDEERLVVVQEVYTHQPVDHAEVIQTIRQAVALEHEVQVFAVVLIEPRTIPKTSSGKIQRGECRRQYLEGELTIVSANVIEADLYENTPVPAGPLLQEALVALAESDRQTLLIPHLQNILARSLGLAPSQIEPERPLPSFGLDSAAAVEMAYEIETSLGLDLRMESLLQEVTLAELAAGLSKAFAAAKQSLPDTVTQDTDDEAPQHHLLSHGQRALWFLHQLHPESPAYNVVHAVKICDRLDEDAFARVFQTLVNRHPSLRTTFASMGGEPVQQVHPQLEVCFRVEDAATLDACQVERRLAEEIYRPFNLEKGPLMRVHLFRRAPDDYILILALHHIITDLWSSAVLMSEIGRLYEAESSGSPATLKPLQMTYVEFAARQNEMLSDKKGEALRRYWHEKLAGDLPALNLATDRPRLAVPSNKGRLESIRLSPSLTARLKELAKTHDATPFMTLLTAFYILLYRYTGQEDLLVGTTRANRTRDVARLVGYFVNPLVLRANLSPQPPFTELLASVRQTALDAFAHGDYPFPLLVEELQPARNSGQTPIFQVMFSWQKTSRQVNSLDVTAVALNEPGQQFLLGVLPMESMALEHWVSPFDLTLLMAEIESGETSQFVASFEYSTDLFDQATIKRMLAHFETLLESIVENPELRPFELPILSQKEVDLLLSWNQPITPRLKPFVPQQIELWAKNTPLTPALQLGEARLTYKELNQRANQLAHYLNKMGVGPNIHVGVYAERSLSALVALLAVLKAGGIYLPLDPDYPLERLSFILEDANVRLLLTQANLASRLQRFNRPCFCLDLDWPKVTGEPLENPPVHVTSKDVAYLIYTSGSTGKPKGVSISHGAIADHIQAIKEHFELTDKDRVLQFASYSFDQGLEQILATLSAGAQLVLRGQDIWPPADFPTFVADQHLSVINLPPAYWEQVVQVWANQPITAPNLRLVIIGGDVVQTATVALWQKLPLDSVRLLNAYGPTETTITATTFEIPVESDPPNPLPIGRPLPNRTGYILDKHGNLSPIGVPGELHIGGPTLANGYWNRPELTAEKFIENPIDQVTPGLLAGDKVNDNPVTPSRLYRTGDLCRWLPDGNIEFLGRVDHQVKIRGFRIELGEIESVLTRHAQVEQAVVTVQGSGHQKKLVAYLAVPQPDKPPTSELKQFLQRTLPVYMVPAHFVCLDALPLTLSGKFDRNALPTVDDVRPEISATYVAPRTPLEAELAQLWANLLEIERVGALDNFFDLGGHSLLATRLASRLRDQYAVEIPLRDLFEAATVANLALLLVQHQAAAEDEAEVATLLEELDQLSAEDINKMLMPKSS